MSFKTLPRILYVCPLLVLKTLCSMTAMVAKRTIYCAEFKQELGPLCAKGIISGQSHLVLGNINQYAQSQMVAGRAKKSEMRRNFLSPR